MTITTVQVNTCNACKSPIPQGEVYVDAMVYGATLHRICWENINGASLARTLGLDDIKWRIEGDTGPDGGKVIHQDNPAFVERVGL